MRTYYYDPNNQFVEFLFCRQCHNYADRVCSIIEGVDDGCRQRRRKSLFLEGNIQKKEEEKTSVTQALDKEPSLWMLSWFCLKLSVVIGKGNKGDFYSSSRRTCSRLESLVCREHKVFCLPIGKKIGFRGALKIFRSASNNVFMQGVRPNFCI